LSTRSFSRLGALAVAVAMVLPTTPALAAPPLPGAIFTTNVNGTGVNLNQYADIHDVYLDGGPGPAAPPTAAGLPDGSYVFQVTDPSGKNLLSTDRAACRQFTVAGGLINGVAPAGACAHATGVDADHGAVTVQLFPFNLTPNPGGVFKVWATQRADYLSGCSQLGVNDGLNVVDCGRAPGNQHGFIPAASKTDNFKIKASKQIFEVDVRFFNDADHNGVMTGAWCIDEPCLASKAVVWTDTLGVQNTRYTDPGYVWNAHVEAPEPGTHLIAIDNQVGCTVGTISVNFQPQLLGPHTIPVQFPGNGTEDVTWFIDVACV
jgi:hypothetical protein